MRNIDFNFISSLNWKKRIRCVILELILIYQLDNAMGIDIIFVIFLGFVKLKLNYC